MSGIRDHASSRNSWNSQRERIKKYHQSHQDAPWGSKMDFVQINYSRVWHPMDCLNEFLIVFLVLSCVFGQHLVATELLSCRSGKTRLFNGQFWEKSVFVPKHVPPNPRIEYFGKICSRNRYCENGHIFPSDAFFDPTRTRRLTCLSCTLVVLRFT